MHRRPALRTFRGPHVHGPSTFFAPDLEDVVALGAFPISLGNPTPALGACQVPGPFGLGLHLGEAQSPGLPHDHADGEDGGDHYEQEHHRRHDWELLIRFILRDGLHLKGEVQHLAWVQREGLPCDFV